MLKRDKDKTLREKAEQKMQFRAIPVHKMSEADIAMVIQELRVHEIELEMQNAALREAQVELETSRSKYADLFDFAPIGYFVFDERGCIAEVNLAGAAMLGMDRRDVKGKPFNLFVDGHDKDCFRLHRQAVFETGQAQQCELRLLRPDETEFVVRVRSQALTDRNDRSKVLACRTAMTNITALIRSQHRLQASERQYRTLAENAPDIVLRIDLKQRLLYVNDQIESVTGISARQIVGQTIDQIPISESMRTTFRREIQAVFQTGRPRQHEFDCLVGQTRHYFSASLVPERTQGGITETVLCVARDITDLKRTQEDLRQREEQLRLAVEGGRLGFWDRDLCSERITWNSHLYKLLGRDPQAPAITGETFFEYIHPEDRPRVCRNLEDSYESGQANFADEFRIVRPDGQSRWLASVGRIYRDGQGCPVRISGVNYDITDRKEAEAKLADLARFPSENPYPVLRLSTDGTIRYTNQAGAVVLAEWQQEVGQRAPEPWRQAISAVMETGRPETREIQANGRTLSLVLAPVLEGGYVNLYGSDISERLRMEKALRTAQEGLEKEVQSRTKELKSTVETLQEEVQDRIRAERESLGARRFAESIISTIQESLVVLDARLTVISANRTFYETFGVTAAQTEGRPIYAIGNQQWDLPALRRLMEDILPHNTSFEGFEVEHNFEHIGPRTMLLNARRVCQKSEETEMILLAIQDITLHKQQEREILEKQQQLTALTEELLLTEERERRQIATALHDSVGQTLAFAKRELGTLCKDLPPALAEKFDTIKTQINAAIQETRSLTFDLSPTTLYMFGLEAALEELAEQSSKRNGFACHFEAQPESAPLPEQIKVLLYRATRELLINVAKHAEARNVHIRVARTERSVQIEVEDDGKGFEPTQLGRMQEQSGGFGLFSIRERLARTEGTFDIRSVPGNGTRVTMQATLQPTEGADLGSSSSNRSKDPPAPFSS